jgi:hypothetical protein
MGPLELAELLTAIALAPAVALWALPLYASLLCLTGLPLLTGLVGLVAWIGERGHLRPAVEVKR